MLTAYKEILNDQATGALKMFHGNQQGNPVRGAEIIYEVVTSTGVAAGRKLPEFLPLGKGVMRQPRSREVAIRPSRLSTGGMISASLVIFPSINR